MTRSRQTVFFLARSHMWKSGSVPPRAFSPPRFINNASFKHQRLASLLLHLLDPKRLLSHSSCSIDTGSTSTFQIPIGHRQYNSKVSSIVDCIRYYCPHSHSTHIPTTLTCPQEYILQLPV